MAVPATRVRVTAMVIAGSIAGIAGGLTAVLERGVGGSAFPVQASVLVFSMAVVGGLGSIGGVLAGVAVTEVLLAVVRAAFPDVAGAVPLATGALLLVVLMVLPGGLDAGFARARNRIGQWLAARHGLAFEVGAAAGSYDRTTSAPREQPHDGVDRATGLVSCRDLTASYGPLQVLFGVDLDVADGEILALLGTNGAGKSTVLKALIGRMANVDGDLTYDGRSLRGRSTDDIARTGIAMMPGGRGVFPTLTVAENLRLAAWQLRGDPAAAARAGEPSALELFPILADAGRPARRQPLRRRAATAVPRHGAHRHDRRCSSSTSSRSASPRPWSPTLLDKVRQVNAAGVTVVIVEQSVNVALTARPAGRVPREGRVRFEGPTSDPARTARPAPLRVHRRPPRHGDTAGDGADAVERRRPVGARAVRAAASSSGSAGSPP